jgi:hypothetical protein
LLNQSATTTTIIIVIAIYLSYCRLPKFCRLVEDSFCYIRAYAHVSFPSWVCGAYPLPAYIPKPNRNAKTTTQSKKHGFDKESPTYCIWFALGTIFGILCISWRTHMPLSRRGSVVRIPCSTNMLLLLLSLLLLYSICLRRPADSSLSKTIGKTKGGKMLNAVVWSSKYLNKQCPFDNSLSKTIGKTKGEKMQNKAVRSNNYLDKQRSIDNSLSKTIRKTKGEKMRNAIVRSSKYSKKHAHPRHILRNSRRRRGPFRVSYGNGLRRREGPIFLSTLS